MRVGLAVASLVVLAGCLTDSPEMTQMRSACAAGNMQACYAVESLDRDQRHRLADQMNGMTLSGGGGIQAPVNTTCHRSGSQVMCTSM